MRSVEIVSSNSRYRQSSLHRPNPQGTKEIKSLYTNATSLNNKVDSMGDFNFGNISWSNGCVDNICVGEGVEYEFQDILYDTFLFQHINISTFQIEDGIAFQYFRSCIHISTRQCE